ncbi:MAG TPA: 5-oxoprolinase subunit PxpA [Micromonosporaceae bacterium]|nr:5-oxoprolinase subunit PxpA [Micromonosporaceae bacterium]
MDLNADLGEGYGIWQLGDDLGLLDVITSANVACGFHAGDPSTMRRVCVAAAERGVVVGAQVGYRDLAGFGRRRIEYDLGELADDVRYQIGALGAFGPVRYVKPHGALYNTAAVDEGQASAVVSAVLATDPALPVLCQPGSVLARLAAAGGLRVIAEGFADRAYRPDGRLVARSEPGALVSDVDEVAARAVRFATDGTVRAVDGSTVECRIDSLCVHGDTPGAVELAQRVRSALIEAGVSLAAFAT